MMVRRIYFLILGGLFIFPAFSLFPQSNLEFKAGRDITESGYKSVWNQIDLKFTDQVRKKLKHYKILLIPGFFSDGFIDLGETWEGFLKMLFSEKNPSYFEKIRYTRLSEYFDEQILWLRDQGFEKDIDFERVRIESEAGPQTNAKFIRDAVLRSQKPVIIIAHSKGGIDTLVSLVNYGDEISDKIKGFIPIQSPFKGSPIADDIIKYPWVRMIAFDLLGQLGGSGQSLKSLTTQVRTQYFHEHQEQITKVLKEIPAFAFTSWKNNEDGILLDTILEWPRDYIIRYKKLDNDGLGPSLYGRFPGMDYIEVEGVDHVVTVMYSSFLEFDRIRFLKTLLVMMLERISE